MIFLVSSIHQISGSFDGRDIRFLLAAGRQLMEKWPGRQLMEKWQREGFDSFKAWRLADQKRRDDAKRAARAAAAAARSPPLPPQPVALAMPFAADARVVSVRHFCPGITCTIYGTAHSHIKRVRVAEVPIASMVRQLEVPIAPTTVTVTDPDVDSPPRRKLGTSHETVEVTPNGSREHTLERTTPRGSRISTKYKSPPQYPTAEEPAAPYRYSPGGSSLWPRLSDASRAAQARGKRKAGVAPMLHAQRQPRMCQECGRTVRRCFSERRSTLLRGEAVECPGGVW